MAIAMDAFGNDGWKQLKVDLEEADSNATAKG